MPRERACVIQDALAFWQKGMRQAERERSKLTLGRAKGFLFKRGHRLAAIASCGVRPVVRHPLSSLRWFLPYWFLRRRVGDVYANAFLRLPSKLRSCIPAGFMRLWSEQISREI